jgi:hypothetical protein
MATCAVWVLIAGRDLGFQGDEVFYYAHLTTRNGVIAPEHGIEYLFAPHNGHLVALGRLLYELLFAGAGTNYFVFRLVAILGYLVCVGLFFELVRRRTSPLLALAFSISILFLGFGYETLIWPFDLHTVFALALGLGTLLALEGENRRSDVLACVLLVLAVCLIELGLCFAVGVAVLVLLREDRVRRLWIFAVPIGIYAVWWLWAHKYGQSEAHLVNVYLIPIDSVKALSAVAGSLFGINPTGAEIPVVLTTTTETGTALAGIAVVGLLWRVYRGDVPNTLWASLAILIAYWITIALGGRPPDTTRYILVGAVMVLLVIADALRGTRISPWALAGVFALVAFAIPANVEKMIEGRNASLPIDRVSGVEFGMLDLVRDEGIDPGYSPATEKRVIEFGGGLFVPLSAGDLYRSEDGYGSLGYSLEEVRAQEPFYRQVADATLVGALKLRLEKTNRPADAASCPSVIEAAPENPLYFDLEAGGALLGSRTGEAVKVELSRFGDDPGIPVGELGPHRWATLRIPVDAAPDVWRARVDGPVYVCPSP